jgi:integrase
MTRLTHRELSRDIDDYLVFKRSLGYSYRRSEATLRSFQRFWCRGNGGPGVQRDLAATIKAWLVRVADRKPVTLALDLGVLRQLCRHRRRRDPHGFVPEVSWAPCTESRYQPYIFSQDQVRALVEAASRHHGRNFSAPMLRMLLLVAYCTGLRFGEAVRLQLTDVDLEQCVLSIRESKGRSRLVPFRSDLARELQRYLPERADILRVAKVRAPVGALFVGRYGRPISLKAASDVVRRLLRQLGMKDPAGRTGPRPYDLRHAFAVHRLTEWYRGGVDIHARLPWLSAYMGHVNLLGTEVYLHATPELLALASERFAGRFARDDGAS